MKSEQTPRIHEIKCLAPYFERVAALQKTFEVRKNDRDYQAGDILKLRYAKDEGGYGAAICYREGGNTIWRRVTYVLNGGQFGIKAGYCVMSIEPLNQVELAKLEGDPQ